MRKIAANKNYKIAGCKDNPEELWHDFGGPDEVYDLLIESPSQIMRSKKEETLKERVNRISRELKEIQEALKL